VIEAFAVVVAAVVNDVLGVNLKAVLLVLLQCSPKFAFVYFAIDLMEMCLNSTLK